MLSLNDLMPDEEMMEFLGDDAIYTIAGKTPIAIKAIVEHNNERVGNESYTTEYQTEVEFIKKSIPFLPQRDDRIAIGLTTYHVDSIVSNDGKYIRVAVRK